jgi:hypothetical protein
LWYLINYRTDFREHPAGIESITGIKRDHFVNATQSKGFFVKIVLVDNSYEIACLAFFFDYIGTVF